MAILKPFKAYRPKLELTDKVAALPYDVMSSEEAKVMAEGNPYSFLHVDKAEIDLADDIDVHDAVVYEKASENLSKLIEDEILVQDEKKCLYIYRLIMDGRAQTGLVGCLSVDDYESGVIKIHEKTRADKEKDRIDHVRSCNAHTGPIFMTYRDQDVVNSIITEVTNSDPSCNFTSEDGVTHIVWTIADDNKINALIDAFDKIEGIYIADGHHRAAAAVAVAREKRKTSYTGDEEFNYFLSVMFPSSQLKIMDYNRVVKDMNGHDIASLLNKLDETFDVEEISSLVKPEKKYSIGMYCEGKWYKLTAKEQYIDKNDPIKSLDVSILQEMVLDKILDIKDPRISDRIEFVGGIRGIEYIEKLAKSYNGIAFSMYPTTMNELMKVADNKETMPPKSTWFEPKLKSGLFIHEL